MPDTVSILIPADDLLPLDELLELTGQDNIATLLDDATQRPIGYRIEWDDVTLTIEWVTDSTIRDERISEFLDTTDDLLDDRHDKKAKKIWRRAERMVNIIDCTVDPDWDEARKAQLLVQGVMAYYDYAQLYADGAVYNENGNVEVGEEDAKPKYWVDLVEENVDAKEVNARKKRSIDALKREKVPYIPHLPPVADEANVTLRDAETVVRRALACNLISRRADGESLAWFRDKVQQYRLQDDITPDEWEFAEDDAPPEYIVVKFSRRMESYWVLLWTCGIVSNLARPDNFANPQQANDIMDTRSLDQFLLEATMRDKSEILDALDLHMRYHWAVIDAELYGKKPPRGLKQDAVYERHYALNWVTQYNDQEWDLVTTDT